MTRTTVSSPRPFASSTTKRLLRRPTLRLVTPWRTFASCLQMEPAGRSSTLKLPLLKKQSRPPWYSAGSLSATWAVRVVLPPSQWKLMHAAVGPRVIRSAKVGAESPLTASPDHTCWRANTIIVPPFPVNCRSPRSVASRSPSILARMSTLSGGASAALLSQRKSRNLHSTSRAGASTSPPPSGSKSKSACRGDGVRDAACPLSTG